VCVREREWERESMKVKRKIEWYEKERKGKRKRESKREKIG